MTDSDRPVENLKQSAWEGLIWGVGFTLTRDVLQFVTMIVLVRLLTPDVYGQMALAQAIVAVLAMISFRTFGKFALQSRDPKKIDWENHFSIGVLVNLTLFCLTTLAAVAGVVFGGTDVQTVAFVVGIVAVVFLMEPLGIGYTFYLQAHHLWKPYRLLMFASAVLSSVVGIVLALNGAGVYALAAMIPVAQIPYVIAYFASKHPLKYTRPRFSDYREGRKFAGLSAANTAFGAGTDLVEKSLFSSLFGFATLGLYTRGLSLNQMTAARIGPVVISTLYPVLTRAEANSEKFQRFARILLSGCIIVSLPVCVFFAIRPEPIVILLFGETWRDVAIYLPVIAFIAFFGQLIGILNQVLIANLRQAVALNLAMIAGVSRLAVVAAALPFGINTFLYALLAQASIVFVAYLYVGQRVSAILIWPIIGLTLSAGLAALVGGSALLFLPVQSTTWLEIAFNLAWQGLVYSGIVVLAARAIVAGQLREFVELLPGSAARHIKRVLLL